MLCPLSVLCPLTMLYSRESPSIGPATYGVGVESKASTSHPTVHTSQSYLLPVKARAALRYKVGLAYHDPCGNAAETGCEYLYDPSYAPTLDIRQVRSGPHAEQNSTRTLSSLRSDGG